MIKIIFGLILLLMSTLAQAQATGFADLQFGRYQIADSQWNVSACTGTTTCQIYSTQPGTMYKIPWTSGQWAWQTGQYVKFEASGNASFPWTAKVYNSNGTVAGTIGTGKVINMGTDANGKSFFFFVGSDNDTGQLFSTNTGMSGTSGYSWTGTLNPTDSQLNTFAANTGSTTPLASGQTYTAAPATPVVAPNPRPTWPAINRPANQVTFGSGRTGGWNFSWWDCCGSSSGSVWSINWNTYTGDGYRNYLSGWMRWPGANNGVSRTIWFRTGYDDGHQLRINGTVVTNGGCCYFAYGSYTAKPGEIVKLEFFSDNYGGANYIAQVAWDPDGDGVYEVLDGNYVALQSDTAGGGSFWYSSEVTTDQLNIMSVARTRRDAVALGNRIDFEEKIGSSGNNVTIEQTGNYNLIQGLGGGNAILDGDTNTLNIRQGDTPAGRNLIELGVYGNNNSVIISQARNTDAGLRDGAESGRHYLGLGINGDSNTVTIRQGNQGAANSGHFGLMYIKGNSNNMTLKQIHDGEKRAFISVDGNNNISSISQGGLGNQYIDLMMTGNGHTANITQTGTGSHRATINLTNAGGSSVLNLTQQGSTGQQYSIVQQCANLNGCSVTLTQGGP